MYMARIGVVIVAIAMAAMPAAAQQARSAAEIVLIEGQAPGAFRVLGEVRAEIHQKSIMPKTPSRDLADQQLRAEAAKLGADAVVDIKYESSSPMFSKKGFRAAGKAVKFETAIAAAPVVAAVAVVPVAPPPVVAVPTPAPVAAPPAPVTTLPVQTVEAAPPAPVATAPVIAQPAPQPAPVAPPVVAAVSPPPTSAPQVSAPGPRAPTAQALIVLTEDNLAGRAVTVLGLVEAEAHQTSLFPKKTARDMLEETLRAKAAALGADAVISIKFDMNSPMLSKKGSRATGVAVKFQ